MNFDYFFSLKKDNDATDTKKSMLQFLKGSTDTVYNTFIIILYKETAFVEHNLEGKPQRNKT